MRPAVAYPFEQESRHFASGVNRSGDLRGLAMSGRHFGITANEVIGGLDGDLIAELANYTGPGMQELFVDSGAFSEVEIGPGGITVKREITDADWQQRFEIFRWAACGYGRRARLVAPDRVGDQLVTLQRLERYAAEVRVWASLRAQIIVPVQKGALPMSEMFRRSCEILGLPNLIAGVPMKKDATSDADLAELVESLPWYGARLHLLGIGPSSKRFRSVIALIKRIRPNAEITSDSVTIRAMVGRTNGRGGGPRVLTQLQDQAKAIGLTESHDVKSYALTLQGWDELRAERRAAMDLGWFDTELFDSVEESIASVDRPEPAVKVA